jgi:KipI family sensor histidine kinase inhibitor
MKLSKVAENACIVRLGSSIDPATLARVRQAVSLLRSPRFRGIIDLIPSYASVVVIFDPRATDYLNLKARLREEMGNLAENAIAAGKQVEIPVYYSEESGLDLPRLVAEKSLSIDDIINLHCSRTYLVYAIGFAPGFAYLGELDERLITPRLPSPRKSVPSGSVAIADRQTAIYPAQSPGGWNLLGLTATRMFDPHSNPAMPVNIGDSVRFRPVTRREFLQVGGTL